MRVKKAFGDMSNGRLLQVSNFVERAHWTTPPSNEAILNVRLVLQES